ncbi:vWA domain-containing protein [Blastococcus saxobsidens]|uniref:Carbon monoxide accessory protein containing a VWA domain n=1 Tax=Blastococcus saxobsidens (strain DD2) TaxID=1146883 RepID=H6RKH9_BLASD|nr:VWA domain-containing protein [Blastococcus saxobsidens]CCG02398.1 Carbon monoxide accessory protein containing a VWA domain [Blastococcus saxobsidens DD2]
MTAAGMAGEELGRTCVEFTDLLRRRGVAVGPVQTAAFLEALYLLRPTTTAELYWAGRAVLATDVAVLPAYARAFAEFFAAADADDAPPPAPPHAPPSVLDDEPLARPAMDVAVGEEPLELPEEARVEASEAERVRVKSFARMTAEERRIAALMIRRLRVRLPRRLSRRRRPASSGRYLDMRSTLRRSLATDGEPARLGRRRRRVRQRPVTLVVDVSGSMTPYAQALLRFGHALLHAGHRVEVYTVGVRLSRVTDALRHDSADRALAEVGRQVADWDGGTLLATSLVRLLDLRRGHAALRGAVVVICSDGLDRDDPERLGAATARLSRLAHRLVWLNPLKGDPRYQPLARGMAAAVPHLDLFLAGHNVASLEELAAVVERHATAARRA